MFLFGLLGLAAMGGAAYAMGGIIEADDDAEEDEIIEDEPQEVSDGRYLEIGENIDEVEEPSTGTTVSEFEGDLVVAGDDDTNILTGQDGDDQINGYGGDDTVLGGMGDDTLHGGDGVDTIQGGEGDDVLHGEGNDDVLSGDDGDDKLFGHFGDDRLDGGDGDDDLYGGQDNDTLTGGAGADALHGGYGDDELAGGAGEDVLFGGDGDDVLTGEDGENEDSVDFLNGGAGDDIIAAHSGDIVTGGEGADSIHLNPEDDDDAVKVMDFEPGQDKLLISWEGEEDPEINIETDTENENLTRVMVDGQDVAQLLGAKGLTLDDIQLINGQELSQLNALS
ncbi:calcium-binding protein [Ruegeria atlantica]|uniref:calcium-binding protein n=1 Tax=Ruegeria atlantica TaxID=81569 RepID=UPI002494A632|nr:calcium-binding protein [Ruegeria atlantica]